MSSNDKRREVKPLAPKLPAGPAASSSSINDPGETQQQQPAAKPKRAQVKAACIACQKGKAKCDGQRPTCNRCARKGAVCVYDVEADTSRASALKARHDALSSEVNQLRELILAIRTRPEPEAQEIFRRLRVTSDPLDVVRSLRDGDLLLQHSTPTPVGDAPDPGRLERLDLEALEASTIRVPARPWTWLAGDGLVSELVSSFFEFDAPFRFPFVDRKCFIADMQAGDAIRAQYCSPLLVAAICALRSCTSDRAKAFGTMHGFNTRDRFMMEAKRLHDRESGRRSLPTVQGLLLMFACSSGMGQDRAGTMYRYTAYEMLKRLRLEAKLRFMESSGNSHDDQKAVARALWGIYFFESMSAFQYLQPSMVRAPTIARRFVENGGVDPEVTGETEEHSPVPLSAYVLNAACDLSKLLYSVMTHNDLHDAQLGSSFDIGQRVRFYQEMMDLSRGISPLIRPDTNFCLETCYLSTFEDMVAFAIFRPLDLDDRLPGVEGTAGSICLQHCKRSVVMCERYLDAYPEKDYSMVSICPLYNCAITLVHMLQDPASHDIFGRTCDMLRRLEDDFPLSLFVLQGLKAILLRLCPPLPQAMWTFFRGLAMPGGEDTDVPVSLIIPAYPEMSDLMSDDGRETPHHAGVELGKLIMRWNAFELSGARAG